MAITVTYTAKVGRRTHKFYIRPEGTPNVAESARVFPDSHAAADDVAVKHVIAQGFAVQYHPVRSHNPENGPAPSPVVSKGQAEQLGWAVLAWLTSPVEDPAVVAHPALTWQAADALHTGDDFLQAMRRHISDLGIKVEN